MSGNVIPRAALKVPLSLGIGRYVCQLKRLTLKFCKSRGDSCGVRDFIEKEVVDFARMNPSVMVYLKPRRHRSPLLVAEYLNGNWHYLRAAKMSSDELSAWVQHFLTRSGENIMPIYKPRFTNAPSIQGLWSPYEDEADDEGVTQPLMTPSEIVANIHNLSICLPSSCPQSPWPETAQEYLLDTHRKHRSQEHQ